MLGCLNRKRSILFWSLNGRDLSIMQLSTLCQPPYPKRRQKQSLLIRVPFNKITRNSAKHLAYIPCPLLENVQTSQAPDTKSPPFRYAKQRLNNRKAQGANKDVSLYPDVLQQEVRQWCHRSLRVNSPVVFHLKITQRSVRVRCSTLLQSLSEISTRKTPSATQDSR